VERTVLGPKPDVRDLDEHRVVRYLDAMKQDDRLEMSYEQRVELIDNDLDVELGALDNLLRAAREERDPKNALSAMGILQHWLARREEVLVQDARVKGASWADIARLLGRSRQAVWERYRAAQATV
jgi:hypothetical protein